MSTSNEMKVRAVQYEIELNIDAPPKRVWRGLTDQLSEWWLPDFHLLGPESEVSLDATAGGGLIERTATGSLLWYTVLEVESERSLTLAGYCTPRWGGPCTTLISYTLEAHGRSTKLKLSDALYGHVSDKQVESLHFGWTQLMNDGLKKFVESGR